MYRNSKVGASEDANLKETLKKLEELQVSIHEIAKRERQKEEAHYAKYPRDRNKHFFSLQSI